VGSGSSAGHDHGKGDNDDNKDKGSDRGDRHIPVVPEANAAWLLVPFLGAVLLLFCDVFSVPIWLKNKGNRKRPKCYWVEIPASTAPRTWNRDGGGS
jgi:hypothetical protein